ncbi:MAG: hypothetical protein ABJB98_00500 [Actinomycetota bacterium]
MPLAVILAGVRAYVAELAAQDAPRVKFAQGWLNDERWSDERLPTPARVDPRMDPSEAAWIRSLQPRMDPSEAARRRTMR